MQTCHLHFSFFVHLTFFPDKAGICKHAKLSYLPNVLLWDIRWCRYIFLTFLHQSYEADGLDNLSVIWSDSLMYRRQHTLVVSPLLMPQEKKTNYNKILSFCGCFYSSQMQAVIYSLAVIHKKSSWTLLYNICILMNMKSLGGNIWNRITDGIASSTLKRGAPSNLGFQ